MYLRLFRIALDQVSFYKRKQYILVFLHWIICFFPHWVGKALITINRKANTFVVIGSRTWNSLRFFWINENIFLWCFPKAISSSFFSVIYKLVRKFIIPNRRYKLFARKFHLVPITKCCCSVFKCSFLDIVESLLGKRRRDWFKSYGLGEGIKLLRCWFVERGSWRSLKLKWHRN